MLRQSWQIAINILSTCKINLKFIGKLFVKLSFKLKLPSVTMSEEVFVIDIIIQNYITI